MHLQIPKEKLNHLIFQWAKTHSSKKQLAKRLEKLLPDHLAQIHASLDNGQTFKKIGKRNRAALRSDAYISYIKELNQIKFEAHQARIQWETHMMLVEARKSMNGSLLTNSF